MRYPYLKATVLAGLLSLVLGCHSHDKPHDHPHNDDAHAVEPLSFTVWTDKIELFVEFPPLIVGKESPFAAHFSRMDNFRPVKEGIARIALIKGITEVASHSAENPSSPGIFRLALTPQQAGQGFRLAFQVNTAGISDTIFLDDISVYPDMEAAIAANPPQPEGNEISFLKEQAWKVDFGIAQVEQSEIHDVIHTSGEILPVKGEEKIISAKSSGIVFFKNKNLQEGREVRAGETLFSISSQGLVDANLEERFKVAKARLEKARADFERAEQLLSKQIIGQKEYERRKMELSVAEAGFQTLTNGYSAGGQSVAASMSGIIKDIMVSNGEFVNEGTPLLRLTNNRRLLLQAEVSQKYLPQLGSVRSANFKTPYQDSVRSIDDFNGKLISYGKMMEQGQNFIPVLFELENLKDLLPGSFVEVILLTEPVINAVVIPKTALMRDYSSNYVFVQTGGESFEKREVKLGIDDGARIQVVSGLEKGEWIVTEGAYQIKMASMSSAIPAHGHTH